MVEQGPPQLTPEAALAYEAFFVPALFGQWAAPVADAARLKPGDHVLDVACGTGVLAIAAAARVAPAGRVVGLDVSEAMLSVAARKAPQIEWRQGFAEALPFDPDTFDAVVSQFGLMFFADRGAAVREMVRVLKPGGHLAVAVWAEVDRTPAYATFIELLQRLFGDAVADGLRAPFALGNTRLLTSLFSEAGLPKAIVTTMPGTARFPTLDAFVYADAKGWLQLDDTQCETLMRDAEQALKTYVGPDGGVTFAMPAHIVTATKD
jgi:SAM-dependent methyltransferase